MLQSLRLTSYNLRLTSYNLHYKSYITHVVDVLEKISLDTIITFSIIS